MTEQRRTIYYSHQIHGNLFPGKEYFIDTLAYENSKKIKNHIINILLEEGFKIKEIIRPEIYKHQISFSFLPDFHKGAIHLIFKPLEYTRPLKNAYNIWVNTGWISSYNSEFFHPFLNPERMISLIEEIWYCTPNISNDLRLLKLPMMTPIYNKKDPSQISKEAIINRINQIIK